MPNRWIFYFIFCFIHNANANVFDRFKEGSQHFEAGQYSDAAASFQEALLECEESSECHEIKPNILFQLGISQAYIGKYYASIESLLASHELKKNDLRTIESLANSYSKIGDYDTAIVHYSSMIDQDPNNWRAYVWRSGMYKYKRNYFSAKKDLEKSLDIYPKNEEALTNMAAIYGDSSSPFFNKGTALEYIEQAYKSNPTLRNRVSYLAHYSSLPDQREHILSQVREIVYSGDLRFARPREYLYLGIIMLRCRKIEEAAHYYRLSMPDNANFISNSPELKQYSSHPLIKDLIYHAKNLISNK